jgi:hypothetical protein
MGASFLSFSATMASVVMSKEATEAAFWKAQRTALVGSMTPAGLDYATIWQAPGYRYRTGQSAPLDTVP